MNFKGSILKIGLDQYTYHRFFGEVYGAHPNPGVTWDFSEFLDHIKTLPLEALSLETCFLSMDEKSLIDSLSDIKIDEISFAWGHPNGFMDTPRNEVMDEVEKYLRISKLFNSEVLRVVGSSIQYHNRPHRPQIEKTVNQLKQLVPLAKDYDIILALENHGDFYLEELEEIIDRVSSPYLGITLDTGNFLRFQEDPIDAIRTFGTKVQLVHAKDLSLLTDAKPGDPLGFACVPVGKGLINFPALFTELRNLSYTGAILIEISGVHPEYGSISEREMVKMGLNYLFNLRDNGELNDKT